MKRQSTANASLIRAPFAVVLAWLIPGLGHIYLGHKARGIVFLVTITLTFATGVAIGGVKTVSYERVTYKAARDSDDRVGNKSWWFFGQIMTGTYAIIAYTAAKDLEPFAEDDTPRYLAWPSGDIGSVYSGVAGLLNLLVIIDALARAEGIPERARPLRVRRAGPAHHAVEVRLSWLAVLFVDPIPVSGLTRALLLLPICLSISVVYKTIKCPDVGDIPKASLGLWITIVLGMWAVAVTLWLLYLLFA